MTNLPIIYDPSTGKFVADSSLADAGVNPIQKVILLNALPAGSCVAIVEYTAQLVTSRYDHNYAGKEAPFIDGILLEGGNAGDSVSMANVKGYSYTMPYSLGFSGQSLYLGRDGLLTFLEPTKAAGDKWWTLVARRLNEFMFVFLPYDPIDLTTGTIVPTPPSYYPDPTTDKVVLNQAMPELSAFKIGPDGKAYLVTANDDTIFIDGITLESGGIGQQVKVGRLRNQWYQVTRYFDGQSVYWLTASGSLTDIKPTDTVYAVVVGRCSPNSYQFVFDPQIPVKLAQ